MLIIKNICMNIKHNRKYIYIYVCVCVCVCVINYTFVFTFMHVTFVLEIFHFFNKSKEYSFCQVGLR